MAVLYLSEAKRGAVFQAAFAQELPDLPFHIATAPDPAAVEYMVTWTAPTDLSQWPNLRLIFSVGAGIDQFDLAALPPHVGVVRMQEPGIMRQMQEMAVMSTLALHRDLPVYLDQGRKGVWRARQNRSTADCRVGVMGLGRLGQAVLQALRPFGFRLAGWSRSPKDLAGIDVFTDLDRFLAQTDILICLLPLTRQTRDILNDDLFDLLPRDARLVHLGRGAQLNMQALQRALDRGLASAFLDVTDPEPLPPDHWAWAHPRVIITPHVASQTDAGMGATHVIAGIRADRAGAEIPGLIDRARGY
ncbi:glyoxylate/hydroxypyruvate reductase A [Paracoccus sp. Z330]|uniref:Glyoxylate/hydroxypyruvate reductase A n=1 Tax=Paracoccus onchidii TaxID=3017813 RepID=A0ABT4ZG54_9RHOB|nr:glyoxylate/hydroxypyruvate reductase A [Paracoccus onchidii]MDB6177660.1 glyoxylate/hydroxypyruvate reductase A [Paracoccus onchidii]